MAIANTASASIANWLSSNPVTTAFDCNGGDVLFVAIFTTSTVTNMTATYNGTSMTLVGSVVVDADNNKNYVFYLSEPDSGSNNIVVTRTGSGNMSIVASSYSGVDTINPIDDYVQDVGHSLSSTSFTSSSLTVSNADNWLLTFLRDNATSLSSSDVSLRVNSTTVFEEIWDTNGPIGATGSQNVVYSQTGGKVMGHTLVSLNVAASVASFTPKVIWFS